MPQIEFERFRIQPGSPRQNLGNPPRPRQGERFLKGPIPLPWLSAAAKLPGKSLHVGIALWYAAGLTRSRVVPLSNVGAQHFGLDRNAKYRALGWLESAGLVAVTRKLGRAPLVTIMEACPENTL